MRFRPAWESWKPKLKWVSLKLAPTLFFCVLLQSCDWREWIKPQSLIEKKDEQTDKSADPADEMMTQGEKRAFHRWLVKEMQEQVFSQSARPMAEVDGWANVLSQRGSIEGVYHGFVYSSEYGAKETGKASTKALRFFAQEMAALDHPNLNDSEEAVRLASERYAGEHMKTPLFTLKRLLGEKVIQESNSRKSDRGKLAAWYASFASRWAGAGVPFGAAQRDNGNEAFHFRWAEENNLGIIQWELLNRVHRILNSYGEVAQAPAPSPAVPNQAGK